MSLAAAIMLISFFAWGAVGMPIGFAMLASAFLYLLLKGQDLGTHIDVGRVVGLARHHIGLGDLRIESLGAVGTEVVVLQEVADLVAGIVLLDVLTLDLTFDGVVRLPPERLGILGRLEAAWRAVFLLVRQLETGSQLKLYLIDISKDELAADLRSARDLRHTETYRLLVEQSVETAGAEPWSILVGNYRFGPENEDAGLLSQLAQIAGRAGAPLLAEASSRLLGCASLASTPQPRDWESPQQLSRGWAELRRRPEAAFVGLALPRFLLRLPYGRKTSSLESFNFEEFAEAPAHEDYLWGNPAFAVGLVLAQSFTEAAWEMRPGTVTELQNLPLHVDRSNGESESKPCAEVLLTEDAVERLLEEGLLPLVSFKNRDHVRIGRFQSIADPPHALAGRWGG